MAKSKRNINTLFISVMYCTCFNIYLLVAVGEGKMPIIYSAY